MTQSEEVHAPLAAPTYLTHVTVPVFRRGRAIATAILLHLAAVLIVLLVLHHRFRAITPDEATVALVIEPSPYVGSGPTVLAPKPSTKPKHARSVRLHAAKTAAASSNATQSSQELVSSHSDATLRLPAPPSHPSTHPKRKSSEHAAPPVPHQGNNQPAGYGLVVDQKIIPARPDEAANQPPAYPPDALAHAEQGRVLLSIEVNPAGRTDAVEIITSSGYAILDNSARDAVSHWHFLPANLEGRAVASTLLLPITFEIDANNQPGVALSKQGQGGFAPLDPPLRAEPLEPDSGQ